ncbi:MAG: FAD synthetase family protein [Oceanobacillus sp.]|nr:FAD synthetase family protein [Oceanobacillus sp.]PAE28402.1 FAD synthetase [Paenibacillus sp. 7884-2]
MQVHCSEELHLSAAVVAIGAFDGVHKGHQKVIQQMVEESNLQGVPSVVYSFYPPPRSYFQGAQVLSSRQEKIDKFHKLGVDYAIIADFTDDYVQRTADLFINELVNINPLNIIVGEDFRFGNKRAGDLNLLKKYFSVNTIKPVFCSNGERISSTRIRELILQGKADQAIPLLT